MASILAGNGQHSWPFLLNSRLEAFVESLAVNATDLVFNHTVFPYATAFMSPQETERLVKVVLERANNRSAVLCQSATVGGFSLRYCPDCLTEDLHDYGEAYWHRAHILPFVQTCDKHGSPLVHPKDSRRSLSCHTITLPGEGPVEVIRCYGSSRVTDAVSKLSAQLLATRERKEPAEWIRSYKAVAASRSFPRQGNGFSSRSILNGFSSFYGDDFLGVTLAWNTTHNAWPILMLREGGAPPFVTPKHVLLQVFLRNATLPEKVEAIKPGKKPHDLREFDQKLASKIQRVLDELKDGTRLTVAKLLVQTGCWQLFRHNRHDLPMSSGIVDKFRHSDHSERQIGRRHPAGQ